MSAAYVGAVVDISFTLTVDDVDTDTTQVVVHLVKPDGTSSNFTAEHDGTGIYAEHLDTTGYAAGHYTWVATATGTVQAVAVGSFDLIDPTATGAPLVDIAPWCDPADVRQRPGCGGLGQSLLDDAARAATSILYALSGRQFSGRLTTTVRPTARRSRSERPQGLWMASWGMCGYAYASGYGTDALAAWAGHSCRCTPPEVELGAYPVTAIIAVKIDGTTIPADEYRIDNRRLLVRVRTIDTATPTARPGWPTCQRLDLPDTEAGTFSVAFAYGTPPPRAGVAAATSLAAELAILWDNTDSETRLPTRVQTISRQGESVTVIDPQDVLDKGRTGIPDVDLFLKSANPAGLQRRAQVWSPDLGSARRPG